MLQSRFGSLDFDFSQDPIVVVITDVTGNYELQVAKESLDEFKMKVSLGLNHRLKPTFSIFLGECQCYPELSEGMLQGDEADCRLGNNDHRGSESAVSGEAVNSNGGQVSDVIDSAHDELEVIKSSMIDAHTPTFNTSSGDDTVFGGNDNFVDSTSQDTTCQERASNRGRGDAAASALRKATPISSFSKVKWLQRLGKLINTRIEETNKPIEKHSDGGSSYKNTLESLIQLLMNDVVCSPAVTHAIPKKEESHKRRIVGGQNFIKYSDGKEYVITYEENDGEKQMEANLPDAAKAKTQDFVPRSKVPTIDNQQEQVMSEEPSECNLIVREIVEELAKWMQLVDVDVVGADDEQNAECDAVASTGEAKCMIGDEKKCADGAKASLSGEGSGNSLEHFFFQLNGESYTGLSAPQDISNRPTQAKDATPGEAHPKVGENGDEERAPAVEDVSMEITTKMNGGHSQASYVPPIPLETTSNSQIEGLWMSFVEWFHPKGLSGGPAWERTWQKPGDAPTVRPTLHNFPRGSPKVSHGEAVYPGQHSFPYFVEDNLRRVNSTLESLRASQPPTYGGGESSQFFSWPCVDSSPSDHLPRRSPLTYSTGRFSSRRCRIFFNPKVLVGDQY